MPSELSISAVQPLSGQTEAIGEPKAVAAPHVPPGRPAAPTQPYVNPTLRLDAALGLVVIEFRDDAGALASTIPSQRQIEAYRTHQQALPQRAGAPAPPDRDAPPDAAPQTGAQPGAPPDTAPPDKARGGSGDA